MKKFRKMLSIILSAMTVMSVCTVSASAVDGNSNSNVTTAGEYIQDYAVDAVDEVLDLVLEENGIGSSIREWFRNLFGYYKIDNTKKLKKAFSEGGEKWQLRKDIKIDEKLSLTKYLKLDGNNKTITSSSDQLITISGNGSLELYNAKLTTVGRAIVLNGGKANLKNITGTSTGSSINVVQNGGGSLVIEGGTYTVTAQNSWALSCLNNSTTTVTGNATFKNTGGGLDIRTYYSEKTVLNFKSGNSTKTCLSLGTMNMSGGQIGTLSIGDGVLNKTGGTVGKYDPVLAKIENAKYPTSITQGASFSIEGTITATTSMRITYVFAGVYTEAGNCLTAGEASGSWTSYDLKNLASSLKFSSLGVGTYIYVVWVQVNGGDIIYLVRVKFTVTESGANPPSGEWQVFTATAYDVTGLVKIPEVPYYVAADYSILPEGTKIEIKKMDGTNLGTYTVGHSYRGGYCRGLEICIPMVWNSSDWGTQTVYVRVVK